MGPRSQWPAPRVSASFNRSPRPAGRKRLLADSFGWIYKALKHRRAHFMYPWPLIRAPLRTLSLRGSVLPIPAEDMAERDRRWLNPDKSFA